MHPEFFQRNMQTMDAEDEGVDLDLHPDHPVFAPMQQALLLRIAKNTELVEEQIAYARPRSREYIHLGTNSMKFGDFKRI